MIQPRKMAMFLMLILLNGWVCCSAVPAAAQGPAALMEKPGPEKAEEEKKEAAPATCGPLISDGCIPIEEHHASLQVLTALSFYPGLFSNNWRYTSAKGNYYTFLMPVKFTYGPTKNLEMYVIVPFFNNFCNKLDASIAGPNGERSASYGGIGDITAVAKYLLLEETGYRPAVTAVGGDVGHQQELGQIAHQPPVEGRYLHGHVPAISRRGFPPLIQLNKGERRALHRLLAGGQAPHENLPGLRLEKGTAADHPLPKKLCQHLADHGFQVG